MDADPVVLEIPHAEAIRVKSVVLEVLKERVMLLRRHGPTAPASRALMILGRGDGRVVVRGAGLQRQPAMALERGAEVGLEISVLRA